MPMPPYGLYTEFSTSVMYTSATTVALIGPNSSTKKVIVTDIFVSASTGCEVELEEGSGGQQLWHGHIANNSSQVDNRETGIACATAGSTVFAALTGNVGTTCVSISGFFQDKTY